jgi:alpha-galactosidase
VYLANPQLDLELHLEAYSAHPVIRKRLRFTNRSDQPLVLSNLHWEDLNLLVDSPSNCEVWHDYFSRRAKAVSVSMDDCVLLVKDTRLHEGFILASEAPGPLKRLEAYACGSRVAAGLNRDEETVFERVLAPGESFSTPACFLLAFANPIPQDVIDGDYARFVGERLTVCDVKRVPSISINTWEPFYTNINRDLLLQQIDLAADLGVDAYQVDDGWFDLIGDWNDDLAKFPHGIGEIAERCRARGMKFGLWMAVAIVDEHSRVAREHPEWVARGPDGSSNCHSDPSKPVMCLASPYYDYIRDRLDQVIARNAVGLLKLDLTALRNPYTPGRNHGCWTAGHFHAPGNDSHARILERLFELVRELKQRHPSCLFDLSYELYGVMDGHDLALTQVADQNWFSNIASPNDISLRREIYQRGRVTRPWTLNFGGALLDQPNAPHYGLFSTMTSHALFWGDLSQLDEATRAHYRRWFGWLKAQRARSDFYEHYLVSDVFPVPDGVSSRDFRHAIPAERYGQWKIGVHPPAFNPESPQLGEFWDGVARLDARGEGPIFLFRPAGSPDSRFQLRVPWVLPNARYRVFDQTREQAFGEFTGEALQTRGVVVSIDAPLRAAVIVLELLPSIDSRARHSL